MQAVNYLVIIPPSLAAAPHVHLNHRRSWPNLIHLQSLTSQSTMRRDARVTVLVGFKAPSSA